MAEDAAGGGVVLAVDLGGTGIKAALVDARGRLHRERVCPTPAAGGPEAVAGALEQAVRELARERNVRAVSAVVPGVVDVAGGRIVFAGNLGMREMPLRDRLAALTGLPTVLEHDVRAAGLAERTIGAARDSDDHLIVVCGTGIAAAVAVGGAVVRGAHGVAGEFGHVPVWPDGEACPCGQRGCLERYASAAAIARRYAAYGGEPGVSAREVAARREREAAAARAWREACQALGIALAGAVALLDSALVVISGGLSEAGAALLDPLREEVSSRLAWRSAVPELRGSVLGARAGVLGAAILGWRRAAEAGGALPAFENWYSPISP
ncbi:MAG TPA: ROK family protein [Solirubrobacteraceae bacterium]|nr:ROK family protein [Solirubrobacteraceae bacterium]